MNSDLPSENRALTALALILSFRMLGLFMIFPVFALYAPQYHYATPYLIGIGLGIYGLTQATLQLPLSMLSDFIGRKPVIAAGLAIFALGSIIAATTTNMYFLIIGRALQGAGAIGSTLMAMTSDYTRVEHRTKAMAILGMTIGVSFALAMVLGPLINSWFHFSGIFWFTSLLAILGMAILFWLPTPKKLVSYHGQDNLSKIVKSLLLKKELFQLNISILLLHLILTASFSVIPITLTNLSILSDTQWHIYLPVLVSAFLIALPLLFLAEKKQMIKFFILLGILTIGISQLFLYAFSSEKIAIITSLILFFVGFSFLEAVFPSLMSKLAPASHKGSAMGIYSSYQFFGIFLGGALTGVIRSHYGNLAIFLTCALISLFWLIITFTMKAPPNYRTKIMLLKEQISKQKAQALVQQLLGMPGVIEAQVSIEDCIAYLKVDHTIFKHESMEFNFQ